MWNALEPKRSARGLFLAGALAWLGAALLLMADRAMAPGAGVPGGMLLGVVFGLGGTGLLLVLLAAKMLRDRAASTPTVRSGIAATSGTVPDDVEQVLEGDRHQGPSATLEAEVGPPGFPESVALLDGGKEAYPRMLLAIRRARRTVLLQVYAFAPSGVGSRFVEALADAARRGVAVRVLVDGWGSARGGRGVAAALREAGCTVRIYHRLLALLVGRFGRNHRKLLLVDDEVAILGGINIGDENLDTSRRPGWADLALEIRGPACARLGRVIRREPVDPTQGAVRIDLCGLGGGWRLRRRYLAAIEGARQRIQVAHGYFLPDAGVLRALTAAARRGVHVRLLLAGDSDVPFARVATRSLYRRLLSAGVSIHEWSASVLHAKVATVDGRQLLLGSFNLDPFSLANMEALVEVVDLGVVQQVGTWIQTHLERSRSVTSVEACTRWQRWLLEPLGRLVARIAAAAARAISGHARRRAARRALHP